MRALAADLVERGWAVWNIEYRRVGNGGGWPETFADVAAAIDRLDGLHPSLDLSRVDVLGHSAGGHLALWAAGAHGAADGRAGRDRRAPRVPIARAISLAGVCDLAGAYRDWHGGAVRALMGGSPERLPERYEVADPLRRVPLAMPVLLVHGVLDETVSVRLSRERTPARRARPAARSSWWRSRARPAATARSSTRAALRGRRSSAGWSETPLRRSARGAKS